MTERAHLVRLELAVCALVATIVLTMLLVAVDSTGPPPAEWCLPLSPLALLALIVACVPAGMTSRRAERLLR